MDNFKDPDESIENGSVVSSASEDNEVITATNGDTLDEENTESNGENTETNNDNTESNSENTESGSDETDEESVTDPEDEGISFDDLESDVEIEFKDCDNSFDQSLDQIVKNIVSETEKQLTAEIRSMREEVAESMRHLEESESLVNEVMKALEAQKVSPDGDHDDDEKLESMTLESEVRPEEGMDTDDISPPSISPSPSPVKEPEKEKMTVPDGDFTSSVSTEVILSPMSEQPGEKGDISSLNPNLLHSTLHNLAEPTSGAAKTVPAEVSSSDAITANNSTLQVDHSYPVNDKGLSVVKPNPPFQVQLQKRKAPVIVKKVSIPPRFEPLPTRRDPSTLQHPPIEPLIKFKPYEGAMVWAMSGSSLMDAWPEAKILKSVERSVGKGKAQEIQRQFQVIFTDDQTTKYLTSKQLAHHTELSTRIPVGERVIAVYKDEDQEEGDFFPAIVAEAPKEANKNRYLVFFDDGYATYLEHKDLRLVYTKDLDVWKDVDKGVRDFVKNYVQQFPKRAMITLKEGDKVRTELNGRIVEAEVTEVDASLVRMSFDEETCEWVYRGSLRFEPMTKLQEAIERKKRKGDIKPVVVPMMEIQPYTQVY